MNWTCPNCGGENTVEPNEAGAWPDLVTCAACEQSSDLRIDREQAAQPPPKPAPPPTPAVVKKHPKREPNFAWPFILIVVGLFIGFIAIAASAPHGPTLGLAAIAMFIFAGIAAISDRLDLILEELRDRK